MTSLNAQLRALLARPGALVVPGAANALTARLIAEEGFEAVYVTGAGISNTSLGLADDGYVGLSDLEWHVRAIRDVVPLPLIVDADTGFGDELQTARTVRVLERAGASAIQIEDQTFPKRCGHFDRTSVISTDDMLAKLRAALAARTDPDLIIIARTDARRALGLPEALRRAEAFLAAGADMIFVEAPRTHEELRAVGELPGPAVANMVEGGVTPLLTGAELGALGFTLVLYANSSLRAALYGMRHVLRSLKRHGSTHAVTDRMYTWEERQRLVGATEYAQDPHDAGAGATP